jgi:hypothetical protein
MTLSTFKKIGVRKTGLQEIGSLGLCLTLACFACASLYGQSAKLAITPSTHSVVSVDKQSLSEIRMSELPEGEQKWISNMPANVYHFGAARVGEPAEAQTLTVRFAAATRLGSIASTKDFEVLPGGSCVEGDAYQAKSSCTLWMRFTPQGAGHRLGKLTIGTNAGETPLALGLNGYGYAPVVSFIPGQITTVAGTYPGGKGLLNGAQNLALDGGDGLYVADTGNNVIRYADSSGVFSVIAGGGTDPVAGVIDDVATAVKLNAPYGVAVNGDGAVYITDTGDYELLGLTEYGAIYTAAGGGSSGSSCTFAAPCNATSISLFDPQQVSIDPSGNVFLQDGGPDELFAYGTGLAYLYGSVFGPGLLVDSYDNLYIDLLQNIGGAYNPICQITGQSEGYSDSGDESGQYQWTAVGSRNCGYAGDGGQAKNAEINASIPQLAMDIAGNLYFSDSENNRVRRVDASTGLIQKIAGNGDTGYSGDSGQATSAHITAPTGVAVGSAGQVYIIGSTGVGSAQVVREVGPFGALSFGNQLKGTASASRPVTISNTGNDSLTVTKDEILGANPGDFSIDATMTSCNFAAGNSLASGQSCMVGIIFKPAAAGARAASFTLLDNTITDSNTVLLTGTGTLPAPTFAITAPAAGASFTSGTAIKFSVSVTASASPGPTGTVTFSVDGTKFGSAVTVASGAASISLTGLSVEKHTISATYSGDANYATATASESITVTAASVKK